MSRISSPPTSDTGTRSAVDPGAVPSPPPGNPRDSWLRIGAQVFLRFPLPGQPWDQRSFLEALAASGYDGRVSVESWTVRPGSSFARDAAPEASTRLEVPTLTTSRRTSGTGRPSVASGCSGAVIPAL